MTAHLRVSVVRASPGEKAKVGEIDCSVFVDICGWGGSQMWVGLVLSYGPDVCEVPAGGGRCTLFLHFGGGRA